jgi:pilus assembly protein Flp/PilA
MGSLLKRFVANDGGATAIEYAMIASLIALLIITSVTSIGTSLSTFFITVSGSVR